MSCPPQASRLAEPVSEERPARVFDIIGKRRWFFLLSGLVTIPGLIFILLTPLTGGKEGIQFTIDYTGGTTWQLKFANPNVTADQVAAVFKANGLQAIVVEQGDKFMDIKTDPIDLQEQAASPTPVPTLAPSGSAPSTSGSPAASGSPIASGAVAASAPPSAARSGAASPP